jgi:y4mF family transcriptional regulator
MIIRSADELGLLIKDRRRARGWDQQTLADHIDASRLWVSEMENGKQSVQLNLVLRTLAALEIELSVRDTAGPEPAPGSAMGSRSAALIAQILDE